jgi:branched-chain amino acid transport system substrate-binding protein
VLNFKKRMLRLALPAALLAGVGSVGFQSEGASAASNNAPGVSSTSITIGVAYSESGSYSSEFVPEYQAFKAAIQAQNAKGGVDGRKINLVAEDDASTAAGNLSAVQSLVETKNAFAIADLSNTQSGGADYLDSAGVPAVGPPTDIPSATHSNFFTPVGAKDANPTDTSATLGKAFKALGAKSVGALGLAISSASQALATEAVGSAKLAGLKKGYLNNTLPIGNTDWTPYVLGFKNSNTDGYFGAIDEPDAVNFITAAQQQGITLKVITANFYDSSLLQPPANSGVQGDYGLAYFEPSQLNTPATKAADAVLKKYANIPTLDFETAFGYTDGLLLIKGLQVAGKSPTRSSFITKLRAVTNWTANGLAPVPVNFATAMRHPSLFGPGNCVWLVKITGKTFVPQSKAPICAPTVSG